MKINFKKTALVIVISGSFGGLCTQAQAAAFALQEQSGSGLGNAFAGGAAEGADASSMFANPATLSRRKSMQVASAMHIATPSPMFRNERSRPALNQPLGNEGGDSGDVNFFGNFYVAAPIDERWTAGLGIGTPFGLSTDYNNSWAGRYLALRSDVKTVNVNPAISFKASEKLSLGVGINWQYLHAIFTSAVNYSAALGSAAQTAATTGVLPTDMVSTIIGATGGLDSISNVKGHNRAWGWNAGLLYEFDPITRIGLSYRSEIRHKVNGTVTFDHPSLGSIPAALIPIVDGLADNVNNALYNGKIHADITLPQTVNLSFFRQITPKLDLMADIQWTGWSSIKELTFVRNEGTILQSTPEQFKNAWRLSVGGNYRFNERWLMRAGVAFDQSPVRDAYRTPRLPDADRYWISVGGQYAINKQTHLDFGFAYLFSKKTPILDSGGNPQIYGTLDGHYDTFATVASMQFTYTF
ncbi:MAG: outer membrane protein transport protein [Burkholderiales bacterium]|jgi:long-chain fatty acid transport protein|nr:outer membrane protein transport protein [Burkholderiales bacterium]